MEESKHLKNFSELLSQEIKKPDSASKLASYLTSARRTGREFLSYQSGQGDLDVVSPADLLAVSLLSVRIAENPSSLKPSSVLLLDKESIASRIRDELRNIPSNVFIENVGRDEYLDYVESSKKIWKILEKEAEVNSRVVRYKLLARKRPLLFPIRDSVLDNALQSRSIKEWYVPWYEAFHDSKYDIKNDLIEVRKDAEDQIGAQIDVGLLRIADMLIWERWLNLCEICKSPVSICLACEGSGIHEPLSPGAYLEPYPCLCSGWNGDPDNMDFWDAEHNGWQRGPGIGCETEGCPGSKGLWT